MLRIIISVVLALIYSFSYTILGPKVAADMGKTDGSSMVAFLFCFFIGVVINIFLFYFVPKKKDVLLKFPVVKAVGNANKGVTQWMDRIGNKKLLFLFWGVTLLLWIPAYMIFYPGILSCDSISQVNSAMGTGITNNHHPILHTWLYGFFMGIGEKIFSSYEAGMGIFSFVQMTLLSYSLARLGVLLKKKKVPGMLVLINAIVSALWFENACLSVTYTKDIIHASFLVLVLCHYVEMITDTDAYVTNKKNLFVFPIVSFLMCAFRNNGIHIYVFCVLVFVLFRIKCLTKIKKYWKLALVIALPVIMFKVYTGPVFNALGIEQGQVREALSVPIQQLQRVAIYNAEELTEEQTYLMDYYITDLSWRSWDNWRQYNPFFADPAKDCFISLHYEEDPVAFWKFYYQTGKQFKKQYIVAFLANTIGYWYPGYYEYSYVDFDNYSPELFCVTLERKSIIEPDWLVNMYKSFCTSEFWRELPFVRVFFVQGFTLWILIYLVIIAWNDKTFFKNDFPFFIPLIAQFGIMILSPMASFRYSWPLYLMLPVTMMMFRSKKN